MNLQTLIDLARKQGTQFNIRLPGGQMVPASQNPTQAATLDFSRGLLLPGNANPFAGTPLFEGLKSYLSAQGINWQSGASLQERTGTPEGPTPGVRPTVPTIPTANFPSGIAAAFETLTGLPSPTLNPGFTTPLTPDQQKQLLTPGEEDKILDEFLKNQPLSESDKAMIRNALKLHAGGDLDKLNKFLQNVPIAIGVADPIFKQKVELVRDKLGRELLSEEDRLIYDTATRQRQIDDLKAQIKTKGELLGLEEQKELQDLADLHEKKVQNFAQTGFTFSSRAGQFQKKISIDRTKTALAEQLGGELVESTKRQFGLRRSELERLETSGTEGTLAEIKRLGDITKERKETLTRGVEEKLGSAALGGLGFPTLGGITGTLPQERVTDIINLLTKGFVF